MTSKCNYKSIEYKSKAPVKKRGLIQSELVRGRYKARTCDLCLVRTAIDCREEIKVCHRLCYLLSRYGSITTVIPVYKQSVHPLKT